MKLSLVVDVLVPCRKRTREREERADRHVRRASDASTTVQRRLGAVRLIIETAEGTETMFGRDGGLHGD